MADKAVFDTLDIDKRILDAISQTYPAFLKQTTFPISFINLSKEPGCLSYLDVPRYERWKESGNTDQVSYLYRGKVGKTILKLCAESNPSPYYIQKMTAEILKYSSTSNFTIISDIHSIYQSNSLGYGGTLGNSCMNRKKYTSWYNTIKKYFQEPSDLKILVLYNKDGIIIGRALLWYNLKIEGTSNRINLVDRIYTNDENDVALFIDWAKLNGFHYKKTQGAYDKLILKTPKGVQINQEVLFEMDTSTLLSSYAPYMDTLTFITSKGLTNNSSCKGLIGTCDSTCGEITCERCSSCNCNITQRFCHPITEDTLCESCYKKAMKDVVKCTHCDKYVYKTKAKRYDDTFYCYVCYDSQTFKCDHCGSRHLNTNRHSTCDNYKLCEDCYTTKTLICPSCGDKYYKDNMHSLVLNGIESKVCEDCLNLAGFVVCSKCKCILPKGGLINRRCPECEAAYNKVLNGYCPHCQNQTPRVNLNLMEDYTSICKICAKAYPKCTLFGVYVKEPEAFEERCKSTSCPHSNSCGLRKRYV